MTRASPESYDHEGLQGCQGSKRLLELQVFLRLHVMPSQWAPGVPEAASAPLGSKAPRAPGAPSVPKAPRAPRLQVV